MITRTALTAARRMVQLAVQRQNMNVVQRQLLMPVASNVMKMRFFADSSNAESILTRARTEITDDLKKELNAVMVFKISGKNYLLEAQADKPLRVEVVENVPEKVDVTLITDEATFVNLAKGKTKPTSAFMSGKLKIKGNVSIAMKAEKLFKALKVK